MPKGDIRDVSPLLQMLRNFLLGRTHRSGLRYEDELATRSPPQPVLPDGPAHKLHSNYYYTRDARREASPPEIIATGKPLLQSGEKAVAAAPAKNRTPGKVFHWD